MKNHSTFYLKYRPQKVADLDLKDIRKRMEEILRSSKIPHAFLFSGPRGLGKTSAARILAKAINCLGKKEKEIEPCGKCEVCIAIQKGNFIDLIEIDAASYRGIDDIRELKEKIKLTPTLAKKKVYVIDEVHMLTKEAFNALLKTLEEPPSHVLFILCTTEFHKLPDTIVSRCLLLDFRQPTTEELIRCLKRVSQGENLEVEEGVFLKIAKYAEGSFRDAVKILEQLTFGGKKITLKMAADFLEKGRGNLTTFLEKLAHKDGQGAILWLDESLKKGLDLKFFLQEILENLRQLLLKKYGIPSQASVDYGFSLKQIKKLINIFDKASKKIKDSFLPQLPVELAILEWTEEEERFEGNNNFLKEEKREKQQLTAGNKKNGEKENKENNKNCRDISLNFIVQRWQEFLEEVKTANHSLEALLRAARPVNLEGNKIVLEVFYAFHKSRLETEKYLSLLEEKIKQFFGYPLRVEYVLTK